MGRGSRAKSLALTAGAACLLLGVTVAGAVPAQASPSVAGSAPAASSGVSIVQPAPSSRLTTPAPPVQVLVTPDLGCPLRAEQRQVVVVVRPAQGQGATSGKVTLDDPRCVQPGSTRPGTSALFTGHLPDMTWNGGWTATAALVGAGARTSRPVTFTVGVPAVAPRALAARREPPSAVVVTWRPDPEPDVAGYRVARQDGSGTWRVLATTSQDHFRDASVAAGHTYRYEVSALRPDAAPSAPATTGPVSMPAPSGENGPPGGHSGPWAGSTRHRSASRPARGTGGSAASGATAPRAGSSPDPLLSLFPGASAPSTTPSVPPAPAGPGPVTGAPSYGPYSTLLPYPHPRGRAGPRSAGAGRDPTGPRRAYSLPALRDPRPASSSSPNRARAFGMVALGMILLALVANLRRLYRLVMSQAPAASGGEGVGRPAEG